MFSRITKMILVCLFLIGTLIATTGEAQAIEDLLAKIQQRGYIVIGNCLSTPPFAMRDAKGNPIGFSIDFYPLIAKKLGVEVKIEDMAWAGLIPALLAKRVDILGPPMLATEERAQKVIFTHAWFFTGTHANIRVNVEKPFKTAEEINNEAYKCGAIEGSIGEWVVRNKLPKCKPVILESHEDLLQAMLAGRIDAAFQDEMIGMEWVKKYPDKIGQIDENLKPVTYSFAVRPDLESYHLKCWFDQFWANIMRSGEYAKIYEKWTGKKFKPTPFFHGRP